MAQEQIIQSISDKLTGGDSLQKRSAVDILRDLHPDPSFSTALIEAGVLEPLLRLLEEDTELAPRICLVVQRLGEDSTVRARLVEGGATSSVIHLLQKHPAGSGEVQLAALCALAPLAEDDTSCNVLSRENGVSSIIEYIKSDSDEAHATIACGVLQRLAAHKLMKNSIRELGGISQMLKKLKERDCNSYDLREAIVQAVYVLVIDSNVNQDYVRECNGVEPLVQMLDYKKSNRLAGCAVACITALCIGNSSNKAHVRELWAIPLLVNLLEQADKLLQEKAVDCLRVLTTADDVNKLSLFSIPAGVRGLIRILSEHSADEPQVMTTIKREHIGVRHLPKCMTRASVITERAAAVIGNLSTSEQFFSAIRESGGLQQLVVLLDSGPESRVTEIAAKTLANVAGSEINRKGIRLAGGLPPLVNLLTQRPTAQVLVASEEALRRLEVTNEERNAILEALRYCAQRNHAATMSREPQISAAEIALSIPSDNNRPLTQYTVGQTCELLTALGIRDCSAFERNSINGGDILDLTDKEMEGELALGTLQVKKIIRLKRAFETFEAISTSTGKGAIGQLELRNWLQNNGRSEVEIQAIVDGYRQAMSVQALPAISFRDFALNFQWLMKTMQVMAAGD